MDTTNIKSVAASLKLAVMNGTSFGHESAVVDGFTITVYYAGDGKYFGSVYIDDVDANGRRWLNGIDWWVYNVSVDVIYADAYGTVPDTRFACLARQAEEDERLAAVDATTLPGRLAMAAAVKANLYHDEARHWRRLDRKARHWAKNQALTGKGDRARLAAKIADALAGESEFSYSDSGFGIGAYWRVSWEL